MSLETMEVQQIKQENDGFDSDSDNEFFDAAARQFYAYKQVKMKYEVRFSYNSRSTSFLKIFFHSVPTCGCIYVLKMVIKC